MPASARLLGRIACPLGDNPAAHVKKDGEKRAYVHCPECGFVGPTRSGVQEKLLLARMRPEGSKAPDPTPAASAATPAAAPVASATPAPAPRRAGLWDQLVNPKVAAHAT